VSPPAQWDSSTRRSISTPVHASLIKPNYLLKIIPHVDGSARILEIVDYRLEDIVMKGAWSGPASST
jgi:acetoacetate decarboxylase